MVRKMREGKEVTHKFPLLTFNNYFYADIYLSFLCNLNQKLIPLEHELLLCEW